MAGLYTTVDLIAVQRKFKTLPAFFLQFFGRQINFETEEIAFDKVSQNFARLAPFVAPNVQGRIIKAEGFSRRSFSPAYLKPKAVVDPNMILPVQPGEISNTGSMSIEQRRRAVIAYLLQVQRSMHENRWEWMAAQALIHGYVDVASEDYPAVRVDFNRDPALTITTDWAAVGANPLGDIKTARRLVNEKSVAGSVVRRWTFGGDAWDKFYAKHKEDLKDLMDTTQRGSNTEVTKLTDGIEGVEYIGVIQGVNGSGRMEVWVNTQKFRDSDGTDKYLMPQNGVLGVADSVDGVRCFGAIMDKGAGYQAMPIYPKNWENEDPSVEYLMTQGAPLMVPADPNATVFLTVG